MDPRDLEHILALYDGEIYYTDRFIGKVLDALEESGLADDTLVVVTSDHGDEFFEHGNKGHAQTLFDEVLMVPLIMRLPGRIEAGLRIPEQVSHLDIAPTLASFAGLEADTSDEGRDLRSALTMKGALPTRGAVSSLNRTGRLLSYRNPGMKYLFHRGRSEITERLYDLSTDPEERVPLLQKSELNPDHRHSLAMIQRASRATNQAEILCHRFSRPRPPRHRKPRDPRGAPRTTPLPRATSSKVENFLGKRGYPGRCSTVGAPPGVGVILLASSADVLLVVVSDIIYSTNWATSWVIVLSVLFAMVYMRSDCFCPAGILSKLKRYLL